MVDICAFFLCPDPTLQSEVISISVPSEESALINKCLWILRLTCVPITSIGVKIVPSLFPPQFLQLPDFIKEQTGFL